MISDLPLRIIVIKPVAGVSICLQKGKFGLVGPASESVGQTAFDLTVNIRNVRADGPPNFVGPFVQGPLGGRFVYVNAGTLAGHRESCWTRRAKVSLAGITWNLIEESLAGSDAVLEARIEGTSRDGGPACASVPLLEGGWRVIARG